MLQAASAHNESIRAEAEIRAQGMIALTAEIEARGSRIEAIEAAAAERLQALESTAVALSTARDEAASRTANIEALSAELADREEQILSLENMAARHLDTIRESSAAIRNLEIERENLIKSAGDLSSKIENRDAAIAAQRRQIAELEAAESRLLRVVESLREETLLDRWIRRFRRPGRPGGAISGGE
jgi:chromosome segregation ATPase